MISLWINTGMFLGVPKCIHLEFNNIITPEILNLIAKIDEFKGVWKAIGNLSPERLDALRHVATIESIGSSTRI
jgi:hypothetical protein